MFINTKLKILYPLLVFSITFMLYIFFAGRLKYEFPTHAANYFSQLAYAFLHGKLDLIHPLWIRSLLFFNGSLLLSSICTISFLLLYFNTGFLQFGSRYLMDAIPLILILLAQFMASAPFKLILFLSFLSIVLNTIGVIWFLNIPLI